MGPTDLEGRRWRLPDASRETHSSTRPEMSCPDFSSTQIRRKLIVNFRPLAPQETDFELLFLGVSVTIAACCFFWLACGLPWPKCWFRHLTGLPCPTCGATRSLMMLVQGHLDGAIARNPLLFFGYLGTLVFGLYCALVLLFRLPRLRLAGLPTKIKYRLCVLIVAAAAMNWIYLLANRGMP